jgi:16S rRNA processing protein RimM
VSANPEKWVILGRVSGVFGVKGWLKVQSYTDPHDNIAGFAVWALRMNGVDRVFEVEDAHGHAGNVVAKLRGLDDRDRARAWVGAEIVIERERLPALEANEFYWTDLEGLEVRTTAGEVLGTVDHLLATGAHDVLVLGDAQNVLIPFVLGSVVKQVDLRGGVIVVDWSPEY